MQHERIQSCSLLDSDALLVCWSCNALLGEATNVLRSCGDMQVGFIANLHGERSHKIMAEVRRPFLCTETCSCSTSTCV